MKWKKISILFSTIFLFIIVCFCMQEHDAVNTVRLVAQAEDHITQSVSLYYDDGVYYASNYSRFSARINKIRFISLYVTKS